MTRYQVYSTRNGVEIITLANERQARAAITKLKSKGIPAAYRKIFIQNNDLAFAK